MTLLENKSIWRSKYNHDSGKHDKPSLIQPKPFIINEGLHAFYTDYTKQITDLKIFVDVEEDLRVHWKIIRDVKYRCSTIEKVLHSIELRKRDSAVVRQRQIDVSDVIIKIDSEQPIKDVTNFRESPIIKVTFVFNNAAFKSSPLFSFINKSINFLKTSSSLDVIITSISPEFLAPRR